MKKARIAFIFIGIIALIYVIFVGYIKHDRECFKQKAFDITSFFNDNNIPLKISKVFYSDILPYKKQPIVLASFLLTQDSFRNFCNALMQNSQVDSHTNEIENDFTDTKRPYHTLSLSTSYHLNGHSIYLYDIKMNNQNGVTIQCLIWLSL